MLAEATEDPFLLTSLFVWISLGSCIGINGLLKGYYYTRICVRPGSGQYGVSRGKDGTLGSEYVQGLPLEVSRF